MVRRKTHEEFIKEVKDKYGNEYEILEKYVRSCIKIKVRHNCRECNYHEWEVTPSRLLLGKGCPVCSGREIKLGVNTIWDTDYWMINLGVSKKDAKRYSRCSEKKIVVKCPDCGREKWVMIKSIYQNKTISCSCRDGKSYPEKFVMNVLEQLNIDFKIEYSPKWIGKKRFDFYIPKLKCIVEAHGNQHYKENFKYNDARTLKQEQSNDRFKREIALKNGIKHYIELDCRNSSLGWIKNSILNSKLSKLCDLSNINWLQCAEFANKNIVKEVCNYWNSKRDDETIDDLSHLFKVNRVTISNYLKRGNKLGWCKYNPEEESKKISKKVEIFKDNKSLGVFESCAELERQSEELFGFKLSRSGISAVCNNKLKQYKGFTFKYVEEESKDNSPKEIMKTIDKTTIILDQAISKADGKGFTNEELEEFLNDYIEWIESKGLITGGSCGFDRGEE